jgi:hypothetical protein
MIRIQLENGDVALFEEDENIDVCAEVLAGEYIVGMEQVNAEDFCDNFGYYGSPKTIILNDDFFPIRAIYQTAF